MKVHLAHTAVAAASVVVGFGWDRVVLALAVLVAVTFLAFNDKLSGEAVIGIYSAIAGYVVGAGHERSAQEEAKR